MTIDIDADRRARALAADTTQGDRAAAPRWMLGVRLAGIAATMGGFVLVGLSIGNPRAVHLAVYAVGAFIFAGFAGGLLVVNAIFADRAEFYRRGHLDGWMRGWRGQQPETDDPLLR